MIEKVEAWKDSQGRLWLHKSSAVTAEFSTKLRRALQAGPSSVYEHKDDIISILTGSTYRTRELLLEALLWYEENKDNS